MDEDEEEGTELTDEEIQALCEGELSAIPTIFQQYFKERHIYQVNFANNLFSHKLGFNFSVSPASPAKMHVVKGNLTTHVPTYILHRMETKHE